MKKLILAVTLLVALYSVRAQEVIYTTTTTNYGYSVPSPVLTKFSVNYPLVTNVTWLPMNDWWYATYTTDDNKITRVYYNTQPYYLERNESFTVSLPVMNTFIPDNVIHEAINKHGTNLFSITAGKMMDSGQTYYVTVINNGKSEVIPMTL